MGAGDMHPDMKPTPITLSVLNEVMILAVWTSPSVVLLHFDLCF